MFDIIMNGSLSIGTDIVEVRRIDNAIRRFGESFINRIFGEEEISYCLRSSRPAIGFSARFAAKEAYSKALGTGIGNIISWKDIIVSKRPSGEPYIVLSKNASHQMSIRGFHDIKLSISHTKTLAHAVVVLM